jgi:hypothetical protein
MEPAMARRDEEYEDDPGARERWFLTRRFGNKQPRPGALLEGLLARRHAVARLRAESGRPGRPRDGRGGPPRPSPPDASTVNWTPLGPSVAAYSEKDVQPFLLSSGRVKALAACVSSTGVTRVYAGAANGGVWLSLDDGAAWKPLYDYEVWPTPTSGIKGDALSVGHLAVRFTVPDDPTQDQIFVGTGEPPTQYTGIGVFTSMQGGAPGTWSQEATNLGGARFYRVVLDPADPAAVYAATDVGLYERPAAAPFDTWTQVTGGSGSSAFPAGPCTDFVIAGSLQYLAFPQHVGSGGHPAKVFRRDATGTWSLLTGIPTGSYRRISLAASPNDPTALHALCFNEAGAPQVELYRLDGTAFQVVSWAAPTLSSNGVSGQIHNLVIAVDPSDVVFIAGQSDKQNAGATAAGTDLAFYRGTVDKDPTAGTWSFNGTYLGDNVHSDAHALTFITVNGALHAWLANDGGVYRSTDPATNGSYVTRNNGLATFETTFLGQRSDTDATLFVGSQDTGTLRLRGEAASLIGPMGDGGGVAVDPNEGRNVMQHQGAKVQVSPDGALLPRGSWIPPISFIVSNLSTSAESDLVPTYLPIKTSPQGLVSSTGGPLTLAIFGTTRLWITNDWGATWATLPSRASPPLQPDDGTDTLDGSNPIVALAYSQTPGAGAILAATATKIFRFDQASASEADWNNWAKDQNGPIDTSGLPATGFTIGSLDFEDAALGTFYVVLGNLGIDHCYYYDGAGFSPTGLTAPDVPAMAVVVDPDHTDTVYVGTDVGCYRGTKTTDPNTGAPTWSWVPFSQGLPESMIMDLVIHRPTRMLRAATYGRGVWEYPLDVAASDPDLYLRANYADTGRIVNGGRYPWIEGASDPTDPGDDLSLPAPQVYHWMSADIKVRRPSLTNPPLSQSLDFGDFAFNIGDVLDDASHMETADQAGLNQIFVEAHNRSVLTPAEEVTLLLLVADASAGLPPAPDQYDTRIAAESPVTATWPGSDWHFVDGGYRHPAVPIDVRVPWVATYELDFSSASLGFPATDDHVCLAAFVTGKGDPILAPPASLSLDDATMADKHVAFRNVHVVQSTMTPTPPARRPGPRSFVLDVHNLKREATRYDLVIQRPRFAGHVSILLPRGVEPRRERFHVIAPAAAPLSVSRHLAAWIAHLQKLRQHPPTDPIRARRLANLDALDTSELFVADPAPHPTLSVLVPGHGRVTAVFTVEPPHQARPGDRFRFEVLQRERHHLVGGSSYVVAVVNPATP